MELLSSSPIPTTDILGKQKQINNKKTQGGEKEEQYLSNFLETGSNSWGEAKTADPALIQCRCSNDPPTQMNFQTQD
jgi:hypothetical protein